MPMLADCATPSPTRQGQRTDHVSPFGHGIQLRIPDLLGPVGAACRLGRSGSGSKGLTDSDPHFNSVLRYLRDPEMTPVLQGPGRVVGSAAQGCRDRLRGGRHRIQHQPL